MSGMVKGKCLGKDRTGNGCRNYQIGSTRFCKIHNYMCDYTPEMLTSITLCKSCNKMQYMDDAYKTCIQCRDRGGENREQAKTKIVYCAKDKCKFKKSDENDYCMKHQLCLFVNETESLGMRVCKNYVRGCKTQLGSDYTFQKCGDCLEKERLGDKKRRDNAVAQNNARPADADSIICSTCCKTYPKESFIGKKNTLVKSCRPCREQNHKQDIKRDKIHRNEVVLKNISSSYKNYIKVSRVRNIHFELSESQYIEIVKNPCYYCGIIQDKGFNGIDRLYNSVGYVLNNCVSCCKACNYMKYTDDVVIYLQRIEHILTYQKIINGNYYNNIFNDHNSIYKSYEKRSVDKGCFLSKEDYDNITHSACYLCGKENSQTHHNGIDRFDNKIGYEIANCRSCCSDCNYLKHANTFDVIIERMKRIYDRHNPE
jgi:hypothetical protein